MSVAEGSTNACRPDWPFDVLDDYGLRCDGEVRSAAAARIAPVPLETLTDPATAGDSVGAAWKTLLDHKRLRLEPADLAVLLAVRRALRIDPERADASLRAAVAKFTRDKTWFEIHFRLAGTLYRIAMDKLNEGSGEGGYETARRLFRLVLTEGEVIEGVLPLVPFPADKLRIFHGIRGVATLILARRDADALDLLEYADNQLALSQKYHDTTAEHFRYHLEVKVRRVDLLLNRARTGPAREGPGDESLETALAAELLGEAEDLLDLATGPEHQTRELAVAEGDVAFRWGVHLLGTGDRSGALGEFERSVTAYETAAERSTTTRACPDSVLALLRGQARFRVHVGRQATAAEDTPVESGLDAVIEDLAEGAGVIDSASYPYVLLYRARSRLWTTDVDGAMEDVEDALTYLRAVGWLTGDTVTAPERVRTLVTRMVRFARVREDEAALYRAAAAEDWDAVEPLLDRLAAVEDEPVYSSTLAHAARQLCFARGRAATAARLMAVSVALERQVPRLRRPVRRSFVASHAATLAVLSFGDSTDLDDVRRVHELYQTALSYVTDPGPELQHHAGVAAFTLAKALQNRDEREREEAAQLLRDALALFVRTLGDDTTAELADAEEAVAEMTDAAVAGSADEGMVGPPARAAARSAEPTPTPALGEEEDGIDAAGGLDGDLDSDALDLDADALDLALDGDLDRGLDTVAEAVLDALGDPSPPLGAEAGEGPGTTDNDQLHLGWLARAPELPSDPRRAGLESRIGECHMRLHGITGRDEHADRALDHFARSRRHGNDSPNLLGLVGDVYYRKGRDRRNAADLRLAVELKSAARAQGALSRENWSVSCAAHRMLFTLSRAREDLGHAIACADEATRMAPAWPWPLFQLAELASLPRADRDRAAQWFDEPGISETRRLTLAGDRAELLRRAAELVINDEEFIRFNLGGRITDAVYHLRDPHRLLSRAVVVKERLRTWADMEAALLTGFADWTSAEDQDWIRVPEVIATVPLPPARVSGTREVALVLQRVSGRPVSALVADRVAVGSVETHQDIVAVAEPVLHALASFHHWRGPGPTADRAEVHRRQHHRMRANLNALGRTVETRDLAALWDGVADLPLVGQRDAHADNWLIPAAPGRPRWVAPIDLEGLAWLPLLFEVAQFIEDFALLPVDERHFVTRRDLAARYLDLLPDTVCPPSLRADTRLVQRGFETFALARAAFVLNHLDAPQRASAGMSTGGRRLRQARRAHCEKLFAHLADSDVSEVATVAAQVMRSP
ncbi:hypothetical protein ACGFWE_14285 [Streptomyces sp. NPDC048523]|uniref:hypothetical protein n=1 Tax=Streptomyces sp. NPDC048523 TaxID=3365567 RepID=UPI00371C8F47